MDLNATVIFTLKVACTGGKKNRPAAKPQLRATQWQRGLKILAPVKMYAAGSFPSMDSSAWQPYWEGEYCVVAWELVCFPANVHLKNNNFTSHEDYPWSRGGRGQKTRPNTLLSCSFLCTPINTSLICIEAICIFGKIPQCWHKSTLFTPLLLFCPLPSLQSLSPPCWTFHCLRERTRTRKREKEREKGRRSEMKGDGD